jgi:hypothetical protein
MERAGRRGPRPEPGRGGVPVDDAAQLSGVEDHVVGGRSRCGRSPLAALLLHAGRLGHPGEPALAEMSQQTLDSRVPRPGAGAARCRRPVPPRPCLRLLGSSRPHAWRGFWPQYAYRATAFHRPMAADLRAYYGTHGVVHPETCCSTALIPTPRLGSGAAGSAIPSSGVCSRRRAGRHRTTGWSSTVLPGRTGGEGREEPGSS